jgi:hypothetical protein
MLVTPTASAPTLAQDNTSRGFSPPCVPSRANPSGLGHAATILLVGPGTPWGRNADSYPKWSNFYLIDTHTPIMLGARLIERSH